MLRDDQLLLESQYLMRAYERCLLAYKELEWIPWHTVGKDAELRLFLAKAGEVNVDYLDILRSLLPVNSPTHWHLVTHAVFPSKKHVIKDQFVSAMLSILEPSARQLRSATGAIPIPDELASIVKAFDGEPLAWMKYNEVVYIVPIFSSSRIIEPMYIDDLDFTEYVKSIDVDNVKKVIEEVDVIDLSSSDLPF